MKKIFINLQMILFRGACLLLAVFALFISVYAQQTGTIRGKVVDSVGALIGGATVTAVGPAARKKPRRPARKARLLSAAWRQVNIPCVSMRRDSRFMKTRKSTSKRERACQWISRSISPPRK